MGGFGVFGCDICVPTICFGFVFAGTVTVCGHCGMDFRTLTDGPGFASWYKPRCAGLAAAA
eukprot:CAMPEP_0195112522 /NCGR_PEP_ID=MMETSP0448-20130528/99347_1 /TAXON_ID=66468 /ORGANISM="Heterocapsa triquestra, Strain CCMP 448" /LENGTH=60 /DNA_ID=CAMNT_0040149379 /DNA_START=51 /DNA_END=229 /DNA_ORIENTATION=+